MHSSITCWAPHRYPKEYDSNVLYFHRIFPPKVSEALVSPGINTKQKKQKKKNKRNLPSPANLETEAALLMKVNNLGQLIPLHEAFYKGKFNRSGILR